MATRKPDVKITDAVFASICARIADGESLRKICKLDSMPSKATVFRALESHPEWREQYAAAMNDRAEGYFNEIVEIADSGRDPAKVRNQVDARKWVLSRMNPRKYGDRMQTEHSGNLTIDPIQLLLQQVDGKQLKPNE